MEANKKETKRTGWRGWFNKDTMQSVITTPKGDVVVKNGYVIIKGQEYKANTMTEIKQVINKILKC